MDRTTKRVMDFYTQSPANEQRYILSVAMLGDVKQLSMRDLSRRFQKLRKNDPKSFSHGFRDMNQHNLTNAPKGTHQVLHEIKQTGKGIGGTLALDGALAGRFANTVTDGMLTRNLEGENIHRVVDSLDLAKEPEMHFRRAANDSSDDDSLSAKDQPERQTNPKRVQAKRPAHESDMNQINVRRHLAEEDGIDDELARKKKLRMRAQRQMNAEKPNNDTPKQSHGPKMS